MPASATAVPVRQLNRLRTEMEMSSIQRWHRLFPATPKTGVEYAIIARVCLPDWIRDGELAPPATPTRAITIRKIAASLGTPPESTRRRVGAMLDCGMLTASAQGVSLAATPDAAQRTMDYFTGIHDLFLRTVEDIPLTCDVDLPVGATSAFEAGDLISRALDTLLVAIDTYPLGNIDWVEMMMWAALSAVATRKVTYDPVLARRFGDAIPADEHRLGISLRKLAGALNIPYATAWRHIQTLDQAGLVTRLDEQHWTILTANLMQDSVRDTLAPPAHFMLRRVRELTRLGLDPAQATRLYKQGRPALADFGLPQNG